MNYFADKQNADSQSLQYFVPVQRALLFDAPHICCYVNNGFVI
jgi:hypothetical protein